MSINRRITEIEKSDLEALVSVGAAEGKTLEFKRELNLSSDDAKRKFLGSVASFANSAGGDMIFGVEAVDGVAAKLVSLTDFVPDKETLRLRDMILAHIEPAVYGFEFKAVQVSDSGYALILRIPKTWSGAHMVVFGKDHRYYTRDGNGRRLMDAGEVRQAYSAAAELPDRIKHFRLERVSAIVSGDLPVSMESTQLLACHLVSPMSFDPFFRSNVGAVANAERLDAKIYLKPLSGSSGDIAYDMDGIFKYVRSGDKCQSSTKLCYNGTIEAVDCVALESGLSQHRHYFFGWRVERFLLGRIPEWLKALELAGVKPPVFICVSLLGVSGQTPRLPAWAERYAYRLRPVRKDPLLLPPTIIESFDTNIVAALRPVFDSMWQACGVPESVFFDNNGNHKEPG